MKWRSRARTGGQEGRRPQRRAEHCARRRAKRSAGATCSSHVRRAHAPHRMLHYRPHITISHANRKSSRLHPSIGSTSIGLHAQPSLVASVNSPCSASSARLRSRVTSARSQHDLSRPESTPPPSHSACACSKSSAQRRSGRRQRCCRTCRLATPSAVLRRRPV